jgi:hypothetical protein
MMERATDSKVRQVRRRLEAAGADGEITPAMAGSPGEDDSRLFGAWPKTMWATGSRAIQRTTGRLRPDHESPGSTPTGRLQDA